MKTLFLAKPRGLCNGVHQALKLLDKAIASEKLPIYVLNEIVHNKPIIEKYKQAGVIFVTDLEDVPLSSTLVFSAHGVAPEVRAKAQSRKLKIIDATCSLVEKVHREAANYTKNEIHIIYIGHKQHEEVIGVLGEALNNITIIESIADIPKIPRGFKKYSVLSQTTLNNNFINTIISELKKAFPGLIEPPKGDICYATTQRQEAVKRIAQQAEVVIVLGSQNSSNSQRLQEIAAEEKKPAYLIDTYKDIDPHWLSSIQKLGLTAGASVPEDIIQDCLNNLKQGFNFTKIVEI